MTSLYNQDDALCLRSNARTGCEIYNSYSIHLWWKYSKYLFHLDLEKGGDIIVSQGTERRLQ